MLFSFREDRFFRNASVVAAALVYWSTPRSLAEGSSPEGVVLFEGGQPRRFVIARDELHFKDQTGVAWVQPLTGETSVERLRARAASLGAATGMDLKLVMYPAGRPRNEYTRRLLTR